VFETPPGAEGGILADYDRVPNPFVLAPRWGEGRTLGAGDEAALRPTLTANRHRGRLTDNDSSPEEKGIETAWSSKMRIANGVQKQP
jgi:hypothetical protein